MQQSYFQNNRFSYFILFCCWAIWYHFYNLKSVKKYPWRSVTFSKVEATACNFTKSNTPPWVFFKFLSCTNSKKSRKASYITFIYQYYTKATIYLFQVNTRKRCKICSKLSIKTSERRHYRRSGVFIINFEHISYLFLVFLLLTLNK